jgi:1-phosphofructokinase family hexose kinase
VILTVTLHPALDKILRLQKLRSNDIARATIEMQYGGGKGNNAARALHNLGTPVIATGYQGGTIGEWIIQNFASEGVETNFLRCAAGTRTSLMLIEEETNDTFAIYEPGQQVTPDEIEAFKAHFITLLPNATMALFCGSAQTAPLAQLVKELITLAEAKGVKCALDGSGLALKEGVKANPSLLKVNREELSELVDHPLTDESDQVKAMLEMRRRGISIVALTRGKNGLLITNGQDFLEGILVMDNVVNVMGCGDSTLAGMAKGISENASLEEVARLAVACGAANTQVIGAGFISPTLVKTLTNQVLIRRLNF